MRLFVDDKRPAPPGWHLVKTAPEAIALFEAAADITDLSLDHDLGDEAIVGNGYHVLLWIEEAVALRGFAPPNIGVHSSNAGARPRMEQAIAQIEKLADQHGAVSTATTASGATFRYVLGRRAHRYDSSDSVYACFYDRMIVRILDDRDEPIVARAERLVALGWSAVSGQQWLCRSCTEAQRSATLEPIATP